MQSFPISRNEINLKIFMTNMFLHFYHRMPVILRGNIFGFEAPIVTVITKIYKTAPKILGSPSVLLKQHI